MYFTTTDPYYGAPAVVVGQGLDGVGARGTAFSEVGSFSYVVTEIFEAVNTSIADYTDYAARTSLTDCVTAATCSYAFQVEADSRLQLTNTPARMALFDDDATTTPNIAYEDDTNTGLGRTGADAQCVYAGGNCAFAVDINNVTVGTGVELWIQNGSASGPSLAWTADTDTGFFRIATGSFGVSTNGVQRWSWADTVHTSTVPIAHAGGTAALPSLTFDGDTDTGFYRFGANAIGATVGGQTAMAWGNHSVFTSVEGAEAQYVKATAFMELDSVASPLPTCDATVDGLAIHVTDGTDANVCFCLERSSAYVWQSLTGLSCAGFE
jgi:hypothetical protein